MQDFVLFAVDATVCRHARYFNASGTHGIAAALFFVCVCVFACFCVYLYACVCVSITRVTWFLQNIRTLFDLLCAIYFESLPKMALSISCCGIL